MQVTPKFSYFDWEVYPSLVDWNIGPIVRRDGSFLLSLIRYCVDPNVTNNVILEGPIKFERKDIMYLVNLHIILFLIRSSLNL